MHFSINVTYIPASAFFTDEDDKICEESVSHKKQTIIPSEYCLENQKKEGKKASHQKSSSINQLHYDIEMISTKALVEDGRKTENGKRNPITENENKFAPYHPPTKKKTNVPKKPVIKPPSHAKKITIITFPSLLAKEDDSMVVKQKFAIIHSGKTLSS